MNLQFNKRSQELQAKRMHQSTTYTQPVSQPVSQPVYQQSGVPQQQQYVTPQPEVQQQYINPQSNPQPIPQPEVQQQYINPQPTPQPTPQPEVQQPVYQQSEPQNIPLQTNFGTEPVMVEPTPIEKQIPITPDEVRLNIITPDTTNELDNLFDTTQPEPSYQESQEEITSDTSQKQSTIQTSETTTQINSNSLYDLGSITLYDINDFFINDKPTSFVNLSLKPDDKYILTFKGASGYEYDISCDVVIVDNIIVYKFINAISCKVYY